MKVKYLFNDQIYIISNHAVAANPIFRNKEMCKRFLKKIDFYLSDLCTIYHYVFDDNQFQILLRLTSRTKFCEYYRRKKENKTLSEKEIPHSTYIFSQAMANLQASLAIHFNRGQKRSGALFARRYHKRLINTQEKLGAIFQRMERLRKCHKYKGVWDNKYLVEKRSEWRKKVRDVIYWCACRYYRNLEKGHSLLRCFDRIQNIDLQGQFKHETKIVIPSNQIKKIQQIKLNFNFNSG